MSQNSESQSISAALDEYHQLMAAGQFRPSTYLNIAPATPRTDAPVTPAAISAAPPAPSMVPTASYAPHAPPRMASPSPTPSSIYVLNVPPRQATASPASSFSPYATAPPTPQSAHRGHLPNLIPRPALTFDPSPGYVPMQYTPPPPSGIITRDMILTRIQYLLQFKLLNWGIPQIVLLSSSIANRIISLDRDGRLGPDGFSLMEDIFMVVGHEGNMRYMALVVTAPIELELLLTGWKTDLKGRDPMKDAEAMEWVRQGFNNGAWAVLNRLNHEVRGVRR